MAVLRIDWSKPIRQKNGRPARDVGPLLRHELYQRAVEIQGEDGYWDLESYTDAGDYHIDGGPSGLGLEIENYTPRTTSTVEYSRPLQRKNGLRARLIGLAVLSDSDVFRYIVEVETHLGRFEILRFDSTGQCFGCSDMDICNTP